LREEGSLIDSDKKNNKTIESTVLESLLFQLVKQKEIESLFVVLLWSVVGPKVAITCDDREEKRRKKKEKRSQGWLGLTKAICVGCLLPKSPMPGTMKLLMP